MWLAASSPESISTIWGPLRRFLNWLNQIFFRMVKSQPLMLLSARSLPRVCKGSDIRCEVSVGFLLNFCDERGHKCGDDACQQITNGLPVRVPGVRARAGA